MNAQMFRKVLTSVEHVLAEKGVLTEEEYSNLISKATGDDYSKVREYNEGVLPAMPVDVEYSDPSERLAQMP